MNTPNDAKAGGRPSIRTVVVRISRKLKATYRLRIGRQFSTLLLAMVAFVAGPVAAQNLPTGMTQRAGSVTMTTPNASSMVLNQATNKAILDWQTFSIGKDHAVQFVQPGASSVALNRVTGGDASSIFGSLSANGQVFLVNPAGVLFAPGAQVNVGGLVASSLSLSDANFLNGRYQFTGSGGSVTNQGSLQGGYVVLAGANVSNSGAISAPGGSVGLLAGSRVTVDPSGIGLVRFSVDAAAANAAISNSGTITADGGQVAVLASSLSDAFPTVINQTGVIRADTVSNQNGMIVLSGGAKGIVDVSGTLQAQGSGAGETGGTVKVLGDRIALRDGARVNASGDAGGGTVLVGGNFQGQGPEQNATVTVVAPGAVIDASATGAGDGGRMIVWSDGVTRFAGTGKVRGGAVSGDGGFAEVSGKGALSYTGTVDARGGPGGAMGTLLLDPDSIEIVAANPDINGDGTTGDDLTTTFLNANTNDGLTSRITAAAVVAQLNSANVSLLALENIDVNAAVDATGNANANRLTLRSTGTGDININQPITLQAGGSGFTALTGGGTIRVNAAVDSGNGTIGLNAGAGGSVLLAADLTSGTATTTVTGITTVSGTRQVDASGTIFNQAVGGLNDGTPDNLTLTGGGTFNSTVGGANAITNLTVQGGVRIGGDITTIGTQNYQGAATIANSVTLASTGAGGNVDFDGTVNALNAGVQSLTVNTTGTGSAIFGNRVGTTRALESLTTNAGQALLGGNVTTLNAQNYNNPVTLTADVVARSTNNQAVFFGGTVSGTNPGGESLTVTTGGLTTFTQDVGSLAVPLQFVTTNGGGVTSLNGNVFTTGAQTYDDDVVLTNPVTAQSTGGGAISFNGTVEGDTAGAESLTVLTTGTTTFGSTVGAVTRLDSLTTDAGGLTRLGGNVTTANAQTYGDNVRLTSTLTTTSTAAGEIRFGGTVNATAAGAQGLTVDTTGATVFTGAVGSTVALASLSTLAGGTTSLGGNVITTGAQTYGDPVTLANDVTLRSTGDAAIGATSIAGGGFDLTLDTGGGVTSGAVGGVDRLTTTVGTNLTATSVSAASASLGGNVTTTAGAQDYAGAVTLTNNVTLDSSGGLTIVGAVSGGANTLAVTTPLAAVFGGAITAGALTVNADAGISLGGNVTTVAGQTYSDPVTLTNDVTLRSTTDVAIAMTDVTGGGNDLTLDTDGNVTAGVVTGIGRLATTPGTDLTATSVSAATASLGGLVDTVGPQTYAGAVALTANTTLDAGGAISVGGAVTGTASTLTVTTPSTASFGSTINVNALAVNADTGISLGGNVTTAGGQTYSDAVTLTAGATLRSTGNAAITLTSLDGNGNNLGLTTTGGVTATGAIGDVGALTTSIGTNLTAASLAVNSASLGGNVTTTAGAQDYAGAVTLTNNVTLDSSGGLTIGGAVSGGANTLAVTTPLAAVFGGAITAGALTVNADAGISLGGNVTTVAGQTYSDPVTLTNDVTLRSTTDVAIAMTDVTGGGNDLTLDTDGNVTAGVVTGIGRLATTPGTDLTATSVSAASASLGGLVDTVGAQTYAGAVALTANTTLDAGGAISVGGAVTGTASTLTVTTPSTATFGSTINVNALAVNADTGISLGGNVTTAGGQTYSDAVTLTAGATLRSTGNAAITLTSLDGNGNNLGLTTTGGVTATGAIGDVGALTTSNGTNLTAASLAVNSATLGGNVTTTAGGQSYATTLAQTAASTLTSAAGVSVGGAVSGGRNLTVVAPGTVTVGGAMNVGALNITGNGGISLGSSVTSTGGQTYTASAGNLAIGGAVSSGGPLAVDVSGTAAFGGTVTATSVAVDADAGISLGGNVTTAGAQTYSDAVTLTAGATLRSTGNAAITLTSLDGNGNALGLTTTGGVTATGAIGDVGALTTSNGTNLTAGSLAVNSATLGGNVTTTAGGQSYATTLAQTAASTLTSAAGVSVGGAVSGGRNLTVVAPGTVTVGGAMNVGALNITGNGGISLGSSVTSTGGQTYTASAGNLAIGGAVSSGGPLAVDVSGTASFGGAVTAPSVAVDADAGIRLAGSVTTTGAQTYSDPVTLTANNVTLAGSAITAPSLAGGGFNLTLVPTATANLGTASGIGTLTFSGGTLAGTYTANTYVLNGGTVDGSLGAGALVVALGTTTLNGTSAAGTVNVNSGTLLLGPTANRLTGATTVGIAAGGTLNTGTAAQTLGTAGAPATVTNGGNLIVGNAVTAGSISSAGILRTVAGSSVTTAGAISATNAGNQIGSGTFFNAGDTVNLVGDFQGSVFVTGATPRVTLDDRSAASAFVVDVNTPSATAVQVNAAGALDVAGMQVAPSASVDLNANNNLTLDAQRLSVVRILDAESVNGDIHFRNTRLANGGEGVIATELLRVTALRGNINTPSDPLKISSQTGDFQGTALTVWIDSDLFTAVQASVVGGGQSETDRFIRLMLRNDAGILPVENLVILGNTPIDAVVAPLTFPSLLIRLPECLAEQRDGQRCVPPRR